ncbi:MAG: winged helix DNA-binding protein [Clostridiales bacterium]|nr:winged helix DNA-binding protein [Clostridiales bacterium]
MSFEQPLTESYFYILLCLYHGPNHGYGIMQDVLELTDDRLRIGSGTMYGAVSNMIKKGWIVETKGTDDDRRKRLYKLTDKGNEILNIEVTRLNELVQNASKVMGR